jgi:hypothetical protein
MIPLPKCRIEDEGETDDRMAERRKGITSKKKSHWKTGEKNERVQEKKDRPTSLYSLTWRLGGHSEGQNRCKNDIANSSKESDSSVVSQARTVPKFDPTSESIGARSGI